MMANFLLTVALSFALILIALLVFRYVAPPVYRVEAINIKRLLELVLSENITTADWDVFIGMPIRHDPELDQIRCECAMLASTEMSERQGLVIFSETGRQQIAYLLEQINQKIEASESKNDR